ncbi:SpoIIE family protein phosphatase [Streptomyces sp. NPDC091259]|uniref:SpoIIE family protein phosphatase n=1 Tax=Streptomyces sp. NPDC091259 TaxID=3365976 RepID=UPI003817D56C
MTDPLADGRAGPLREPGDDAYVILDAQGLLTAWTPAAERLLGCAGQEVPGLRCADLPVDESDLAGLGARLREGAAETVRLGAVVLRHRSGRSVEVELEARRLVWTGDGCRWLVRATEADTARHRELGAALVRGLFTESPFDIDVFDTELRFLAQNAGRRRAGWFGGEDFTGHTMAEVSPPGLLDTDAFEARQRQVLDTGEALIRTELRGRSPDDPDHEYIWSETILPLRDPSGQIIALARTVTDVTERARADGRLALVNAASTRIGTTLDVVPTAQELCDVTVPRFADHAYVNLLSPVFGGQEPVTGPVVEAMPLRRTALATVPGSPAATVAATGEVDPFISGAAQLYTRVMTEGRPLLLTGEEFAAELEPGDPEAAAEVLEEAICSWLLVPMSARGAVLGAVEFIRYRPSRPFEQDDVLLAQEIVARAAVCIDNARRYTQERKTALALQRTLLPQELPALAAVEAVSRYLPANGHTELGGAWFDVIPLSGAQVALVVGDVPGQGLHSAVTMGRLRTAVRTLADLGLSPEELLTHLDDQVNRFQGDENDEEFTGRAAGTTCVYAVFDPISRSCVVARAGHPAPALISREGSRDLLDLPGGPPLGMGGAPFESGELTLDDGDLLVLCTAGLAKPSDQDMGSDTGPLPEPAREALAEATRAATSEPSRPDHALDDISDRLIGRLIASRPDEDVALLAVRVHALATDHHVTWDLDPVPEIVGRARALTTAKLAEWGLQDLDFTTELLVSELVTNAIRYGAPPIRLRLIRDRTLICEVTDASSTSPHIRRALVTDEGGRGLFMVAQLAQLWGTRYHSRGKTIWAEQPLPDPDPDPDSDTDTDDTGPAPLTTEPGS